MSFLLLRRALAAARGVLLARGFLISFLDNVYHYATPVNDVFYARNLRLPAAARQAAAEFQSARRASHQSGDPVDRSAEAFDVAGGKYQGEYFAAALRQLRGPIALQELPAGAPVRVRPF